MRIAYLTNQYPKVSHTFIRREIRALTALGVDVLRYSIRGTPDTLIDPADQEEAALTQVLLADGAAPLLKASALVSAQDPRRFAAAAALAADVGVRSERGPFVHGIYLAEACLLLQQLRAAGAEHVHVHFGTNPATVAMLCRELGGPTYSFTAHGPEEFDKPFLIRLQEKIARAAFVAGVSHFGRGQLMRHSEYAMWNKLQVVRCGVDAEFLRAQPTPLPAAPRLLYIGRFNEQKGPLLLVKAAAELKRLGVEFELEMIGDGPMREEAERLIAEHALSSQVKLLGWASGDEVAAALQRSRALVLPSLAEGLPVVIMEALALGRPVLSTYIAGIPELVRPRECGFLVPSGSLAELVTGMRELLATPLADLARMGEAGRDRVRIAHDVDRNAARLHELFRRAVAAEPMPEDSAASD